jgi:CsoR family transcriptional regulator, copper-sensing transcriptional repressor
MTTLRNETRKKDLSNRLAKVEGQLRGIRKLMEADADCEKIAQQMAAARKALDKTFFSMVGCMVEDKHLPIEKITQMLVKLA